MRVPAVVVLNALPILTVVIMLGVPQGDVPRGLAFLGSSFLATGIYIVSVATLIRITERRSRGTSSFDPGGSVRD